MNEQEEQTPSFADLGLSESLLAALDAVGYESPSPIQARMIPHVMEGRDVVGQAQTGTGKTAAFALPLLSRLDLSLKSPQALVLTPTRELAIQVAEAFHRYAHHLKGFHVLPIYGGQAYEGQLRHLKRGVHVVVGTPGRVMDHMRRGTLDVSGLSSLVLDEADEMLRMGFIDDVEWVLDQTPPERQIALFSATMPREVRRIAERHLTDPVEVTIEVRTTTAETIRQRFWMVSGLHKLDALTRILEVEEFDGMMIFVRTKTATLEVAEKLQARGFAAAALNGDLAQKDRERRVERLKSGKLDILVATDVAARGLDVERISHVVNYDIPYDTEAYVHRIGRTGRAGRSGEAILFVSPRERHLLRAIERATRQRIDRMSMPSTDVVNDKRVTRFKEQINETLGLDGLTQMRDIVSSYVEEKNIPALDVAAALAIMVHGDRPLLLDPEPVFERPPRDFRDDRPQRRDRNRRTRPPDAGMARFRIEVGHVHGVKPGQIVGAIANEVGLDSKHIGYIDIFNEFSTVDLPEATPRDVLRHLKKVRVAGQAMRISRQEAGDGRPHRGRGFKHGGHRDKTGRPPDRKVKKFKGNKKP